MASQSKKKANKLKEKLKEERKTEKAKLEIKKLKAKNTNPPNEFEQSRPHKIEHINIEELIKATAEKEKEANLEQITEGINFEAEEHFNSKYTQTQAEPLYSKKYGAPTNTIEYERGKEMECYATDKQPAFKPVAVIPQREEPAAKYSTTKKKTKY